MASSNGSGSTPFEKLRGITGVLMFGTASLLAVLDAMPFLDYTLDNVTFLLLLGTGSVLLGVEAFRRFVG